MTILAYIYITRDCNGWGLQRILKRVLLYLRRLLFCSGITTASLYSLLGRGLSDMAPLKENHLKREESAQSNGFLTHHSFKHTPKLKSMLWSISSRPNLPFFPCQVLGPPWLRPAPALSRRQAEWSCMPCAAVTAPDPPLPMWPLAKDPALICPWHSGWRQQLCGSALGWLRIGSKWFAQLSLQHEARKKKKSYFSE